MAVVVAVKNSTFRHIVVPSEDRICDNAENIMHESIFFMTSLTIFYHEMTLCIILFVSIRFAPFGFSLAEAMKLVY